MKKSVYLYVVLALTGFTVSGFALASDQVVPEMSVEQYKAAIQSFGLSANQAEQAAHIAVNVIKEKSSSVDDSNALASVPADFLDSSPW